jgi:hypothetical protein
MAPFMDQIQTQFGAPTSLEDFERKAQMLDYVDHRAIFEGMNAHLWMPNTGRLLWMTQPAWPSNTWQIMSHDYDTQASYYGVKKACEPLHIQLDIATGVVSVVNTTIRPQPELVISANVYSLDNRLLLRRDLKKDASPNATTDGFVIDLNGILDANRIVLIKLELRDSSGALLSDNFYWLGADGASYRALNRVAASSVSATAKLARSGDRVRVHVQLRNTGSTVSLLDKLTLLDAKGQRVLPAYYSDNYVSLLPGESRIVDIEYSANTTSEASKLAIRGWNMATEIISIE